MHYNSSTRKERGMKIGDKVWVIVQDEDDGVMMALPQIPQEGYIADIENINESNTLNISNERHVGEVYYIVVDNDSLNISPSNIFLSENIAWVSWESKMRSKCEEIQKRIDKRSST
jgi:bifunctional DNA-binding transcriptional regulator/antitoxin component of YhaV-PrlF toxin-antitoxin module